MMKCPKDAQTKNIGIEHCTGKHKMWECTRPKNHRGKHHAHDYDYDNPETVECCASWTQEEALVEAL